MTTSLNGLWTAAYSTHYGAGTGVVVLRDGILMGGDTSYYYTGDYIVDGTSLDVNLVANHFAGPTNNVFGNLRQVRLRIRGSWNVSLIMAQGYNVDRPQDRGTFKLQRVRGGEA